MVSAPPPPPAYPPAFFFFSIIIILLRYNNNTTRKYNDAVDRASLLDVLACYGIPTPIIAVSRQLRDGMRARLRLGYGEYSEWFNVEQGLRQGCGLSPLPFNIYMGVILQRFAADAVTLPSLTRWWVIQRRKCSRRYGEWCRVYCTVTAPALRRSHPKM